jgi:hypothetical protein
MGIDTLNTYYMTNDREDFTGPTYSMDEKVLGTNNDRARITQYGPGKFVVQDDEGVQCNILIPE